MTFKGVEFMKKVLFFWELYFVIAMLWQSVLMTAAANY